VHCTAGIYRATLTVEAYLTFILGMPLDEAEQLVKGKRPQAQPCVTAAAHPALLFIFEQADT
jgi:hypothetical protein